MISGAQMVAPRRDEFVRGEHEYAWRRDSVTWGSHVSPVPGVYPA